MGEIMQESRRAFVIGGLTLPLSLTLVGCAIQSLSPIKTTPTLQPTPLNLREARVGQSWKYLKINQFNSEPIELIEDQISAIENGAVYARDPQTLQSFQIKKSDYFGLYNRSKHTANIKFLYHFSRITSAFNFFFFVIII
jgi:hypothetical protein